MAAAGNPSPIVQYVVLRADLMTKLAWNVGAVVAQAVHASLASVHLHYGDDTTQKYLVDTDRMHTVVLEIPDESAIRKLSAQLNESGVDHKLWTEQPEDYPTCLATKPYPKEEVQRHFKKFKLFKGPPLAVTPKQKDPAAPGGT